MNRPITLTGIFAILSVLFIPKNVQAEDLFEEIEMPEIIERQPYNWLDYVNGRVSLKGGEVTKDEEQHAFATRNSIPFTRTWGDYLNLIETGHLVKLDHQKVSVLARQPYVLENTAKFVYELAEDFASAACGRLTVTSGGRLTTRRPRNGSPFSVHPAGMAVDIRIRNLNQRCKSELESLLKTAEAEGRADTTEERWPPHMHVVVIPELPTITVVRHRTNTNGQGL